MLSPRSEGAWSDDEPTDGCSTPINLFAVTGIHAIEHNVVDEVFGYLLRVGWKLQLRELASPRRLVLGDGL